VKLLPGGAPTGQIAAYDSIEVSIADIRFLLSGKDLLATVSVSRLNGGGQLAVLEMTATSYC
jgi:hypothetical protein